ncbi:hypothetical protein SAMN02910401_00330 [Megasphaera elsdenii]|uniref:phage baseplate protein n=1 Tax=Megasphaera elsdenii TaxID=907 RepID=UPI0008EC79EB|nr:hypothetical protein [Megasphaera elsdenii]SFH78588.1 hypothetical protein SAMN02910401_00330 [Megasphaera elsdenii]
MATWGNYVITDAGRKLLADVVSGSTTIQITKIAVSSANYSQDALVSLTELTDVAQEFKVAAAETVNDTTIKITANITNKDLKAAYQQRCIGVYAKKSNGFEILFAVAIATNPDTFEAASAGVIRNILTTIYITTSNASSISILVDMDTYVTKAALDDAMAKNLALNHPIGEVYMCVGGKDPAVMWGGTWKRINAAYLLASGSVNGTSYAAGQTGGSYKCYIQYNNMPPHSHTRGNMNITGGFPADDSQVGRHAGQHYPFGAFYVGDGDGIDLESQSGDGSYINFDASRTWTGNTSIEGGREPITIMPTFYAVDVWVRTA